MTLGYGIGLGTIGIILTIIGFAIAYHYGSKPKPKNQRSILDELYKDGDTD